MASFSKFIAPLLKHEGGYVWDKADKGGETYRGIARNYHPGWPGWKVVDAKKVAAGGSIKKGTIYPELENDVIAFYQNRFWNPIKGAEIKTQEIADIIADWFINGGLSWSNIQKEINKLGQKIGVDGAVGPVTIKALNTVDQKKIWEAIRQLREDHYKNLA
jgi:lysozyme family protein